MMPDLVEMTKMPVGFCFVLRNCDDRTTTI